MELQEKIRLAIRRNCLSPKVGEYQPNMLIVVAIIALSIFQSVGKLPLRSRRSRFATSYYLLIHFAQAAYAFSCLFHPSQQDSAGPSGFASPESNDEYFISHSLRCHVPKFTIFRWHGFTVQTSISFSLAQTELNILGLKYGSIRRIKEHRRDSPGKRFRRDLFPRCERFSKERSASVVRFSDRRRSIFRQIEFFRRSKNAVYNRYDGAKGNIRSLGL